MLAACLGLAAPGCHRESKPAVAAPELPSASVQVREVTRGIHRATEAVVGTVRARLRSTIEAKASGRIQQLLVAPGDKIEAGTPLVRLDVREIQARVDQTGAILQQAERDLERFRQLLKDEAVTRAEYDAVEARQRVARASQTEAETMLGYAVVNAPFAGIVTRKLADVGDLAAPGRALLEIEDPTSMRFEADVPVSLSDRIKLGDTLPVELAARTDSMVARVSEIEPSADQVSRTFRVKLDLPAGTGARAGGFGRVLLPAGETPILTVPTNAVIVRGQMELAFAVQEGRARLRLVKTGKRLGSDVEILSGLESGERVVAGGVAALMDGQIVTVR